MKGLETRHALAAAGMALCFMWVFGAHPTVDAAQYFSNGSAWSPLMRLASVGLIPGLLLPLFSRQLLDPVVRAVVFSCCCALRVVGGLVAMAAGASPDTLWSLTLLSNFLSGSGAALCLVFWGLTLWGFDQERNESIFVVTFLLAGASVAVLGVVPRDAETLILLAAPVAELAAWFACQRKADPSSALSPASAPEKGAGPDWRMLVRVCLAITVVGFVWELFSSSPWCGGLPKLVAFGGGLIASSMLILAFTRLSPSVGFAAATRWVLPVMAIGLFFAGVDGAAGALLECLFLACAHASMETVLRMQVIASAQDREADAVRRIGWGFAAIMAGAFLGPAIFHLLVGAGLEVSRLFLMGVLAFLVVASAFLFPSGQKTVQAGSATNAVQERELLMSEKYGLTPRETEVLGYLLEGRSYPYIRDRLYISQSTVNTHVRHIYAKAGVNSKQALIDLSMDL